MAKQRFSLDETMKDARQGIEEARREEPKPVEKETPPAPEPDAAGILPEPEAAPECPPEEGEGSAGKKQGNNPKLVRIRRKIRKLDASERNLRNVYMDDDTLEKLEAIKKRINRSRDKERKEDFVGVTDLLNVAVTEFIERYYDDVVKL